MYEYLSAYNFKQVVLFAYENLANMLAIFKVVLTIKKCVKPHFFRFDIFILLNLANFQINIISNFYETRQDYKQNGLPI